ncbi:MAG: lasso peptide biosynthesis B2 protein [Clostridium sp.]|nr:lasso peptide biosynthesis B2 protein [Clostridium sp.]
MRRIKLLLRKLETFIKLDNETKNGFIKAYIYTGLARAYILFVPFNKLRKRMGKVKEESADEVDKYTYKIAMHISEVVEIVSRHTPWESKCLVKALTAQKLLKEEDISTTIYLGVKKDKDNNMLAHAWTRCGKYYVTGGANKDGYAVVAKFSN